jgi:hypothetical protein
MIMDANHYGDLSLPKHIIEDVVGPANMKEIREIFDTVLSDTMAMMSNAEYYSATTGDELEAAELILRELGLIE